MLTTFSKVQKKASCFMMSNFFYKCVLAGLNPMQQQQLADSLSSSISSIVF
jgi:hypothetical protein